MIYFDYGDFLNYGNVRVYEHPKESGYVGEFEVLGYNPYYGVYDSTSNYMRQDGMRQNGGNKPPTAPPPAYIPAKTEKGVKTGDPSLKAVDPGSIKGCRYRYVYIWQRNGRSYWAYLTYVGRRSIAGWRWMAFMWVYFGIDLRKIDSFLCV
jgi:hypothetical protein